MSYDDPNFKYEFKQYLLKPNMSKIAIKIIIEEEQRPNFVYFHISTLGTEKIS